MKKMIYGHNKRLFTFLLFILCAPTFIKAVELNVCDSIVSRLIFESTSFLQEKIYLHHDKPVYVVGEDIWFRIHKVDARTHVPEQSSRYVYVELINPVDSVVCRVKIRPEDNIWSGFIPLDGELSEGVYYLRAYTKLMESMEHDYFFQKKVQIVAPMSSKYNISINFPEQQANQLVNVELQLVANNTKEKIRPDFWYVINHKQQKKELKMSEEGSVFATINRSDLIKSHLLIRYEMDGKFHSQYIPVPSFSKEFDVAFFPEGGNLIAGKVNQVAFKSINSEGTGENVVVTIKDDNGNEVCQVESRHKGMGVLSFAPQKERKYVASCINDTGGTIQLTLPDPVSGTHSLKTNWRNGILYVGVLSSSDLTSEDLYLLIHCRGNILYCQQWDFNQPYLTIREEDMPAGVNHIILVNNRYLPVSERLIFCHNQKDLATTKINYNKDVYSLRDHVKAEVQLTDGNDLDLKGSFSVSITDDKDVLQDSTMNILSNLLLTSELKGFIEEPAWYFREMNNPKIGILDILMMTQGWRRYDIPKVLKGESKPVKGVLEIGPYISGKIKGGAFLTKTAANYPVTLLVREPFCFEETESDSEGNFSFESVELPDSVTYVIQARNKRGGRRVELSIDQDKYPNISISYPRQKEVAISSYLHEYIHKSDQKYVLENGMRMIYLKEVEVVAKKKSRSIYSSPLANLYIEDDFNVYHDIFAFLRMIPGLKVNDNDVVLNRYDEGMAVIIDNQSVPQMELQLLSMDEIETIEIFKNSTDASFLAGRGQSGAIVIMTKPGTLYRDKTFNMEVITPLGYQVKKEFYSPRYDVKKIESIHTPDLRTTIYWNPNISAVNGKSYIDFYTADAETSYSLVVEGVTENGKLIRYTDKIIVKQ